jgi:hypothetical protein
VPAKESPAHRDYIQSKSATRWRCDMHPAFNRNFTWVALNARPGGHLRQVMVAYLGDGPQRFFKRLVREEVTRVSEEWAGRNHQQGQRLLDETVGARAQTS